MDYDDDYYADYETDEYPYYEDEYVTNEMTWTYEDLFHQCFIPTLLQGVQIVTPLLLLCMAFRLITFAGLPPIMVHLFSFISGVCGLYIFFDSSMVYILCLGGTGYILLFILHHSNIGNKGAIVALSSVTLLIIWELWLVDPIEWHKIRGSQMMLSMRIISLAIDMDRNIITELPNPIHYLGYCYFVGAVIFGPWVNYQHYSQIEKPEELNLSWVLKALKSFIFSISCLLVSVCLSPVLTGNYFDHKWIQAYRDAMSFRFSHYFVSFMSESCCTVAGLGSVLREGHQHWDLQVVKPLSMELPRSLVDVVTNWNIPMHTFLKNYIFKSAKSLGSFPAIVLTYAASAILHGLNFQLAAVLLSLAIYSYIEYVLRKRLGEIFNSCVLAKKCPSQCNHVHKETSLVVFVVNFSFGFVAMFHLAYLGVMFDSSNQIEEQGYEMEHTLSKWSNLDYASHYVAIVSFLFLKLI